MMNFRSRAAMIFAITILCVSPLFAGQKNRPVFKPDLVITIDSTGNGFYADDTTDNSAAIQAAIDSCYNAGGGTVRFMNGTFQTGPIQLMSNVTLEIDSTATLLATQNVQAYYPAGYPTNLPPPSSLNPLITSDDADSITITGKGTIDGNGQPWWTAYETAEANGQATPARPRLIQLNHTNDIVIENITLKNSPQFHVSLEYCWNVTVKDVTILAPPDSPNTDGIDPATCHNVHITGCLIDNGDDNIAIKSGRFDPTNPSAGCSNIVISGCTFLHGHGVSMGSETSGGDASMTVDSCTFDSTTNGLRIKSYRGNGGNVRGITYSNITMSNVQYPIWMSGYYPSIPSPTDPAQPVTATTPDYHNITMMNITSTGSPYAGLIIGLPEMPMTDMVMKNVNISSRFGLQVRNATIDTANNNISVSIGLPYVFQVGGELTDVKQTGAGARVTGYKLFQNYPNPFNPSTIISYQLPSSSYVSLKIFDVLGREVASLVEGVQKPGSHEVKFDGSRLSSGVYFYALAAGGRVVTKKMILMK